MKKFIIAIVLIIVILVIITILFPQEMVRGGLSGGPIGPGESAYMEEYQCLGIQRKFCPNWPDYGCDHLCYGIIYSKKCFITKEENGTIQKYPTECK